MTFVTVCFFIDVEVMMRAPIYAKEGGRSSSIDGNGQVTERQVNFSVKFEGEEETSATHRLKLLTDEGNRMVLSFELDGEAEDIEGGNEWVQGLLDATGHSYCAALPRTFVLEDAQQAGTARYALTDASLRQEIQNASRSYDNEGEYLGIIAPEAAGPSFNM